MDHRQIKDMDLSLEHKVLKLRSRQIIGSKTETLLIPQEKSIPCEEHHEIADFQPNCINCIHISLYNRLPIGMYF